MTTAYWFCFALLFVNDSEDESVCVLGSWHTIILKCHSNINCKIDHSVHSLSGTHSLALYTPKHAYTFSIIRLVLCLYPLSMLPSTLYIHTCTHIHAHTYLSLSIYIYITVALYKTKQSYENIFKFVIMKC